MLVDPPKVTEHPDRHAAFREAEDDGGWHAGPWSEPWPSPLCPQARQEPIPCDCGYAGEWEARFLFPMGGGVRWQERCPGCGDIESFDGNGNISQERGPDASVLRFIGESS